MHQVNLSDLQYQIPSAIQFRLGGCKGVVAVDPTLHGEQIILRESMVKFFSEDTELEVVETSSPSKNGNEYYMTVVNCNQ